MKIVRMMGAGMTYFCIGTVIAQLVLVTILWFKGNLSSDRIYRLMAAFHNVDMGAIKEKLKEKAKMSEHPEHTEYRKLARDMEFHESKQFEADDQKVALVDIDETVCAYGEKRRYDLAVPINKNIQKINDLYDKGWYIIY